MIDDGCLILLWRKKNENLTVHLFSELANNYKEDGNFNFKYKKYRLAIIGYTEGIRTKCKNDDLIAQLYNNRAASHYMLQNYRYERSV